MLAQKMGLADPNVALRQKLDENFTFYVVYGSLTHSINYVKSSPFGGAGRGAA